MLEVLEANHPGMHTTHSVDFEVVVFGEMVLEEDDGSEAALKVGDCVIQNGTRLAWQKPICRHLCDRLMPNRR